MNMSNPAAAPLAIWSCFINLASIGRSRGWGIRLNIRNASMWFEVWKMDSRIMTAPMLERGKIACFVVSLRCCEE